MCGFTLAGNKHVFHGFGTNDNICLCNGLYGFLSSDDENVLYDNQTKHIKDCFNNLSDNLRDIYLKYMRHKALPYTVMNREDFELPSYWNPNMEPI